MTRYNPQHYMVKLAPAQFHCNFPSFHYVERFLQTFPNTLQALRSVEFKFLLKVCKSVHHRTVQINHQRSVTAAAASGFTLVSW
jgi:hypothetical protein